MGPKKDNPKNARRWKKIKSTAHGLSAIARGIQASIIAQDKRFERFERQLEENSEKRLLEFRAVEAEKETRGENGTTSLIDEKHAAGSHSVPNMGWNGSVQFFCLAQPASKELGWPTRHIWVSSIFYSCSPTRPWLVHSTFE